MSGSRQISPTGSDGCPDVATFWPAILAAGVLAAGGLGVAEAVAVAPVLGNAPVVFGPPFAMLLTGLDGIGGATRDQVSPPHRKPSTQPLISSWSGPVGLIVEL